MMATVSTCTCSFVHACLRTQTRFAHSLTTVSRPHYYCRPHLKAMSLATYGTTGWLPECKGTTETCNPGAHSCYARKSLTPGQDQHQLVLARFVMLLLLLPLMVTVGQIGQVQPYLLGVGMCSTAPADTCQLCAE